jgi:hypothetical protein
MNHRRHREHRKDITKFFVVKKKPIQFRLSHFDDFTSVSSVFSVVDNL